MCLNGRRCLADFDDLGGREEKEEEEEEEDKEKKKRKIKKRRREKGGDIQILEQENKGKSTNGLNMARGQNQK